MADSDFLTEGNVFSKDRRLDKLLQTVVKEVKSFAEDQIRQIKSSAEIGLALSVKTDINALFEKIVDQARTLSNADGGTLYTLNAEGDHLCFCILQNASMGIRMGGNSGFEITLPDVPLYFDGDPSNPNYSNVASHVAITGEIVNIHDVYDYEGFDFSGTRNYDKTIGYQSKSMLVIPLKNHEDRIIGVLQLLNAQDPETGKVVPFSHEYEDLILSLASQAAVALTNTQLIKELRELFIAFIESIATAIDKKSPFTGDHIRRVVDLSMLIARRIDDADEGPFKNVHFTDDELEEFRLAAWMHDVGKITTPEHLVNKATKLEGISDRFELIETRFHLIGKTIENAALHQRLALLENGGASNDDLQRLNEKVMAELKLLDDDLAFIKACNTPSEFMSDEMLERLREISNKRYLFYGKKYPYLKQEELVNLSIRKGTLNAEERKVIEGHAMMTYEILRRLPLPRHLKNLPLYAAGHHLKVNGEGYPEELRMADLPLQSRIMAVADVFEALTAKDRPYKKAMSLSQALDILGRMKDDGHIDPDIYTLFIQSRIFQEYAVKELAVEQIDYSLPKI